MSGGVGEDGALERGVHGGFLGGDAAAPEDGHVVLVAADGTERAAVGGEGRVAPLRAVDVGGGGTAAWTRRTWSRRRRRRR